MNSAPFAILVTMATVAAQDPRTDETSDSDRRHGP